MLERCARAEERDAADWSAARSRPRGRSAQGRVTTHKLGDAERQVERLARVQPRVAQRHVTQVQVVFVHFLGTPEALGHVLTSEFEVDPAGPGPLLPVRGEEAL